MNTNIIVNCYYLESNANLVKSDYLQNQLKRRCILKQIRTSDAILLQSNTLFTIYFPLTDLVIAHSHSLILAHGTYYRMTYGRSNFYIVSEIN